MNSKRFPDEAAIAYKVCRDEGGEGKGHLVSKSNFFLEGKKDGNDDTFSI